MRTEIQPSEAGGQYATAHATHYGSKDLRGALDLYRRIVAAHPSTEEAAYSRSQIQNIVNAVVPKQRLFNGQVRLALTQLENGGPTDESIAKPA